MSKYIIDEIKDFDLDHIFDCGQCFRWEKQPDGSYTGIAFNKVVNMQVDDGRLIIDPCTKEEYESIWRTYLDMDRDYGAIKETLCADDPVMKKAADYGYGIRILNQDLWETIVSFIISQNNNIPRIKGCIERLCQLAGEPVADSFAIPVAEKLASMTEEDLAGVRLGYRSRYLIETAKCVCDKGLPENEEQLLDLCGVGPKVANCILLFGMNKYDSFPIDVWVRRVMHELYGIAENDKKAMTVYAREHFGDLGGFAQQYLFYYIRSITE